MPEILRMPEVAAGATEAVLGAWNIPEGQAYAAGDLLVTIETDKALVEVEAEADGVVLRHLAPEGASVEVGAPIAVTGVVGEVADEAAIAALGVAEAGLVNEAPVQTEAPAVIGTADLETVAVAAPGGSAGELAGRMFSSPLARKMAREAGIALDQLKGTGPGGRIRRSDVEAFLASSPVAGAIPPSPSVVSAPAAADYTDVPNTRIRKATAARLTESKQTAPHFYLRGSARVDRLLDLRKEINDGGAVKVSVNDLIVKAVARAHGLVPELNVIWTGEAIRHFSRVDVGVAVATENGLVTPVVRGADRLSLGELAAAAQDLYARAKERRLQQSELEGGSISVTNLGMLGTEEFAAILNPPQSAILAVGAARKEPVVADDRLDVATVLRVTLSVDHRAVDGAMAAEWMRTFLGLLENPAQILV